MSSQHGPCQVLAAVLACARRMRDMLVDIRGMLACMRRV